MTTIATERCGSCGKTKPAPLNWGWCKECVDKREASVRIANATSDAYSFDAFGETEWRKAARMLLERGYNEREAEAILRSKWTRWARDAQSRYEGKAKDLADFLDTTVAANRGNAYNVKALVAQTF